MMQAETSDRRIAARLRPGQAVSGTVVQVGKEFVFVDVGSTVEGRIDRRELEDKNGALALKVGDRIDASVVDANDVMGPILSVSLGRGRRKGAIDVTALENAQRAQIPVEGTVGKAVKGGLEVSVGGVRAFCPASQIDSEFVKDLTVFEGQTLTFLVVEVKSEGRDVIVSRRALLEQARNRLASDVLATLSVGGDYPATVSTIQKYGAFVDLGGGLEGLIHVSELAHGRVERVEDLLNVGDNVTVKLLAIEPAEKKGQHPRLRLSLKALSAEGAPRAGAKTDENEVLEGTVSKHSAGGIVVDTPKGSGLVPQRELGLPHQADYRRVFPIGKQVTVVVMNKNDSRGLTFSISRVDRVQERANYQAFTRAMHGGSAAQTPASSLGSFGDLLRKELKLPAPSASALPAEVAAPTPAAAPAKAPEPSAGSGRDVAATAQSSGWNDFVQQNSGKTVHAAGAPEAQRSADKPAGNDSGVIRRQRKS
ncbi:MAG: S1 RNA-binding domain-containing protein [Polyangiaceae bacterium]